MENLPLTKTWPLIFGLLSVGLFLPFACEDGILILLKFLDLISHMRTDAGKLLHLEYRFQQYSRLQKEHLIDPWPIEWKLQGYVGSKRKVIDRPIRTHGDHQDKLLTQSPVD